MRYIMETRELKPAPMPLRSENELAVYHFSVNLQTCRVKLYQFGELM